MNKQSDNTNSLTGKADLEDLIRKIQEEEELQAKQLHRFYILYVAIIAFFSGMYILNPDPGLDFYQRLTGAVFISAFILMAFVIRKHFRRLRTIDYTKSVYHVFKKAAQRYQFWETKRMILIAVFVLLVDVAVSMVFNGRYLPDTLSRIEKTLIVQAFYIPLMAVSFTLGWLQWRKTKKPVFEKIGEILNELEEGND